MQTTRDDVELERLALEFRAVNARADEAVAEFHRRLKLAIEARHLAQDLIRRAEEAQAAVLTRLNSTLGTPIRWREDERLARSFAQDAEDVEREMRRGR